MVTRPIIHLTPRGTFRVQFRRNGVSHNKTFKLKSQAEAYLDRYGGEQLTFETFAEHTYKKTEEWLKLKPRSKLAYDSRLKEIYKHIGSTPLCDLTQERLSVFMGTRRTTITRLGKPVSSDTVRQEIVLIGRILGVAKTFKRVPDNQASPIKKPEQTKRKHRLTQAERANLMLLAMGRVTYTRTTRGRSCCHWPTEPRKVEAGRFLFILSDIGGRASELAELPIGNIDYAQECLYIDDPKSGEPQKRYFSQIAARFIQEQVDYADANHQENGRNTNDLLFPTNRGTPHDYQGSIEIVRTLGLVRPECSSHWCRRDWVSFARENSLPDADISHLVGMDIGTIERYDVSTGETEPERARRHRFVKLRSDALRAAMGDAKAKADLDTAVANSSEVAALDAHYAAAVVPTKSPALVMEEAVERGEITADMLVDMLVKAKTRAASS